MIRSAHLIHSLGRDAAGVRNALLSLVKGLHARGHPAFALGFGESDDPERSSWPSGALQSLVPTGPRAFGYSRALRGRLDDLRPDVVHQHGLWNVQSLAGPRWGRAHSRRRLVSPHGMLEPWALERNALVKSLAIAAIERRNLRTAGCLHALTEAERDDIRAIAPDTPICVIPNGVELPAPGGASPTANGRGRAGIASADGSPLPDPYLLFLSRIHEKKNVLGLVDAWARLEGRDPGSPWHLVIAGWGDESSEAGLRRAIASRRLARCRFVGSVFGTERDTLYARARALVLPSFSEGLPVVALEAMAHGTPVLLSAACALDDAVAAGAGWRIGTGADELAEALERFMLLPARETALAGSRGTDLVRERYSGEAVVDAYLDVYSWLNGARPVPRTVS